MRIDDMSLNIFTLANVLRQLDPSASPTEIIKRLSQIDLGLSAEDEFQCIAVWLGKCLMCHKLEEVPFVSSDFQPVRVPDVVAVFSVENRTIPVAVEVKSTSSRKLSWKNAYYEELSRYGFLTGLPVLVAWKHADLGIWTLTDISAFCIAKKNRILSTSEAFRENLLGVLAGDVLYQLIDGVGLHIEALKKELLRSDTEDNSQTWKLVITKAWFTDGNDREYRRTPPGIWPLFLASHLTTNTEVTSEMVRQHFVVDSSDEESKNTQWLHRALPLIMHFTEGDPAKILWRQKLLHNDLPTNGGRLKDALRGSFGVFSKYVLEQQPVTLPPYLEFIKRRGTVQ